MHRVEQYCINGTVSSYLNTVIRADKESQVGFLSQPRGLLTFSLAKHYTLASVTVNMTMFGIPRQQ